MLISIAMLALAATGPQSERPSSIGLPGSDPADTRRGTAPPDDKQFVARGNQHKVIVHKDGEDWQASLARLQVLSSIDYGSFLLCEVEAGEAAVNLRGVNHRIELKDEYFLIQLRNATIDTSADEAPEVVEPLMIDPDAEERQLMIVQFVGPPKAEWLERLQLVEGAVIVSPVPSNAYLVFATLPARESVQRLAAQRAEIQWIGPYHSAYAIEPTLFELANEEDAPPQRITVQLVEHEEVNQSVAAIKELASSVERDQYRVLKFRNLQVTVPAARIEEIAQLRDVVNVEPNPENVLYSMDECQGQILANALSGGGATLIGPGYLDWLESMGFGTTFSFVVDVTDSGIDRGSTAAADLHQDFLDTSGASRVAYAVRVSGTTVDATSANAADFIGHGTINCAIVGGLNEEDGDSDFEDADGYKYGLGIAPHAQIGSTVIFGGSGGAFTSPDFTTLIDNAYMQGARISSNSWGVINAFADGEYDAVSQEYDALVRDARPTTAPSGGEPGNQQISIVFAAGNAGSGATTIGDRGATAKNTITVGASENIRINGDSDGCGQVDADADDSRDIIDFSSRGPCEDGRIKPDIVAPGVRIQGAASQIVGFNGAGVCGSATNDGALPPADAYFPTGQTLYTWSSGTSHACPAVSGAAALTIEWFNMRGWPSPSPAMVKAWLLSSSEYLTGVDANDTLPSSNQGLGRTNLQRALDIVPRLRFDQARTFTSTGESAVFDGFVTDSTQPVRITLAWTDAPGTPFVNPALVNDLDLTVVVGGSTFLGNVFSGANSITGGAADDLNNVESVFLPAGTTGAIQITVTASSIVGDGVPDFGGLLDQDFALVAYNVEAPPRDPIDIALVLDKSGSMNSPVPAGTRKKIDLLKDAVELFVKAWQPFSVPDDRIGVAYFDSSIDTFPSSPILQPYESYAGPVITDVRNRNPGGMTAMGGGMQTAINELPASGEGRFILLFTDGMQNYNPMVVPNAGGELEIRTDPSGFGDSGVPGAPGVSLASRDITMHAIGTGVSGAPYEGLLMDIADETEGLFHFTSAPDEDLELFFLNDLVASLQGATPRMAKHVSGQVDREQAATETFSVNGTATKAVFVLSWDQASVGSAAGFELVAPGSPSGMSQTTERGAFYQITTVDFISGGTNHIGQWQMQISSDKGRTDYRAYLILDDHVVEFDFRLDRRYRWIGKPIKLEAFAHRAGNPIRLKTAELWADISVPKVATGTLFAKMLPEFRGPDLRQPRDLRGWELRDPRSIRIIGANEMSGNLRELDRDRLIQSPTTATDVDPVIARMEALAAQDAFRKALQRDTIRVTLYDDGKPEHGDERAEDGVYSALFDGTAVPGHYDVQFHVRGGSGDERDVIERVENRSLVLRADRFDPIRSEFKVGSPRVVDGGRLILPIAVRPTDAAGNLLGPGYAALLKAQAITKDGSQPRSMSYFEDSLDGSYLGSLVVESKDRVSAVNLLLHGKEVLTVALED